jgi:hypothetical protein
VLLAAYGIFFNFRYEFPIPVNWRFMTCTFRSALNFRQVSTGVRQVTTGVILVTTGVILVTTGVILVTTGVRHLAVRTAFDMRLGGPN